MIDGKSLLRGIREGLNENTGSEFLNSRTSYDYLLMAATEFVNRTGCLKKSQSISTVQGQTEYDLNVDFMRLDVRDQDQQFYIRVSDGTTTQLVKLKSYDEIYFANNTTQQDFPSGFAIVDKESKLAQIAGAASADGASTGGKSRLTAAAADFTNVSVGDIVHNVTDGSSGVVVAVVSTTVLDTALFEGTANDWSSADTFVIQPQGRMQIRLDAPSGVSGYTITVPYVPRPEPVYTDYDVYRIPAHYLNALVGYAAFLYKYKDKDADFGQAFYTFFERETKNANATFRTVQKRGDWGVNFKGSPKNGW